MLELAQALRQQATAIDRQCDLLGQLAGQNADLLAVLIDDQDDDGEPRFDLAGNPIG